MTGKYPARLHITDWIEANKGGPFFAFLSFYSVHGPIQSTKTLWEKYRAKATQQTQPQNRFLIDRTSPVRQVQDNPLYAGMIESMDDGVGIVLERLNKLGLLEDTIIVFTSDNGGVSAGDGKSLVPVLTNNPTEETHADLELLNKRTLFWHYPHYGNQGGEPSSIIRKGDWKLISYHQDDSIELYNVADDIGEATDVASKHPEIASSMKADLDKWLIETDAAMPSPNPKFSTEALAAEKVRIREKTLPKLERQHEQILGTDYRPPGGWWEETGK